MLAACGDAPGCACTSTTTPRDTAGVRYAVANDPTGPCASGDPGEPPPAVVPSVPAAGAEEPAGPVALPAVLAVLAVLAGPAVDELSRVSNWSPPCTTELLLLPLLHPAANAPARAPRRATTSSTAACGQDRARNGVCIVSRRS